MIDEFVANDFLLPIFKEFYIQDAIFVETGCNWGNGLLTAKTAGYKKLYSCDIDKVRIDYCRERFPNQIIEHKTSVRFLDDLLPTVNNKRLVFWLDAHTNGGGDPLMDEIALIKKHCKDNKITIIIDDIPIYFKTEDSRINLKNTLKEIRTDFLFKPGKTLTPDYVLISYEK